MQHQTRGIARLQAAANQEAARLLKAGDVLNPVKPPAPAVRPVGSSDRLHKEVNAMIASNDSNKDNPAAPNEPPPKLDGLTITVLIPFLEQAYSRFSDLVNSRMARFQEDVVRHADEQLAERDRFLADQWIELSDKRSGSPIHAMGFAAFMGNLGYDLTEPVHGTLFDGRLHATTSEHIVRTPIKQADRRIASVVRPGVVKDDIVVIRPVVRVYRYQPAEMRPLSPSKQTKKVTAGAGVQVNVAS